MARHTIVTKVTMKDIEVTIIHSIVADNEEGALFSSGIKLLKFLKVCATERDYKLKNVKVAEV